jgi:hypothetical protein
VSLVGLERHRQLSDLDRRVKSIPTPSICLPLRSDRRLRCYHPPILGQALHFLPIIPEAFPALTDLDGSPRLSWVVIGVQYLHSTRTSPCVSRLGCDRGAELMEFAILHLAVEPGPYASFAHAVSPHFSLYRHNAPIPGTALAPRHVNMS